MLLYVQALYMMRRRFVIPLALGLAVALSAATFGSRSVLPVDVASTDANITRLTARLLEDSQFSHHPLDTELAGRFLDRYLDSLDTSRVLFLQSDVEDFARYRATLAQVIRRSGDTSAARAIFSRYLERLKEQTAFVSNALQSAKFDFTGHDAFQLDRESASRPRDLQAARQLWWEQLRAEYLQEQLGDKKPDDIVKILNRRQTQLLRSMQELTQDDVLEIYLNALAHVYDPHSDYFGHEQMDNFAISMNLSLFGIGATLQSDDGACKISELVPGGPAARSGLLKPGDRIIAVAQAGQAPVDILNMPLWHAVELIRGPKGTVVSLTIIPATATDDSIHKTITLVRDQVKLEDEQAKARIVDWPGAKGKVMRLGVIDLPSFYGDVGESRDGGYRSCSEDVAALLKKLKAEKVRGVILDLRHNGGGSLQEAINLTGLFIPAGPVVQTRGPDGDMEVGASTDSATLYDGPLIVLTSRFSASASEILAGALQDYGRAVIVGDPATFGKGTVQTIVSLASVMDRNNLGHAFDPGALKVTIRKFYRPSGASTQLKGVASNIVLPSQTDIGDVAESALKDPLPWDTVASAAYEPLGLVRPYVDSLRDSSARRVAAEKDFVDLREDVARLKKGESKTVSLNEGERRKEMAEEKARQAEFDKASAALTPALPTYDLTLENIKHPGPLTLDHSQSHDIILTETEHILVDYAHALGHRSEVVLGTR